jgi:uncharacterized protein (DUF488 family)
VPYNLDMASVTFTIGYAGRSVEDFLARLKEAGVDRVVDVRELPLSRRKGFSKTALSAALAANNIEYVHLRQAGNPYRDQKDDITTCLALYSKHLDQHPEVIDTLDAAVTGHRAALLCFEHAADECHRSVLSNRLQARKRTFVHL